jgi:hypothetical protein
VSSFGAWLLHLADPCSFVIPAKAGIHPSASRRSTMDAGFRRHGDLGSPGAPTGRLGPALLARLLDEGQRHRVLPAMTRGLRRLARDRGPADLFERPAAANAALDAAEGVVAEMIGFSELLRSVQGEILADFGARGIPVVALKGASFADRLYPDPALRSFSDIDILVPGRALAEARRALAGAGLELVPGRNAERYAHENWRHHLPGNSPVELHWNIVSSVKMRRAVRVSYEQLTGAATVPGDLSATALLYLAVLHGAVGHGFERLQHVFDVVQAARGSAGPIDRPALRRLAEATSGELALEAALLLTGRIAGDPATLALARDIGCGARARGLAALLGRATTLEAQGARRRRHSWRRQLFRELLVQLG